VQIVDRRFGVKEPLTVWHYADNGQVLTDDLMYTNEPVSVYIERINKILAPLGKSIPTTVGPR